MSENQESEAPLDLGIEGVNGRVEIRDGKTYWMGTLVHPCDKCGVAATNVDDCGHFGDPECPRFGIGREEFERRNKIPSRPEWKPDYSVTPRRVVCAAITKDGRVVAGARHFDKVMRDQMVRAEGPGFWKCGAVQGFIDQFGDFMDREEAWKVAAEQGQIRREVSSPGKLYSENLY